MKRSIDTIILHCSAAPNGRPDTIEDCDRWHLQRGFQRRWSTRQAFNDHLYAVGYHWWICVDGTVQPGRHPEEIGAHAAWQNANSLGICLAGTDQFSQAQWNALDGLIQELVATYPNAKVCGHRDLPNVTKDCPGFNVKHWFEYGKVPQPENLLEVTA